MVVAAAREIRNGEVVFVGMRLPLLAYAVARSTHAPDAVGLYENGVIREAPAEQLIYTMADGPNLVGATMLGDMLTVMGPLAAGRVHLGFLGAAQVDRFGNLNSTQVNGPRGQVRLPGSGGACDIASLAGRVVALMKHEVERLVPRVDYITSPGWGEGKGWRESVGLARGGTSALITTRGVIRFDSPDRVGRLASFHPGETFESVRAHTGWELEAAPDCGPTPEPMPAELAALHRYDPDRFWTG